MTSPFSLSGRVALVTGGNTGLGLGMARGLAAAGASIVLADRNGDSADAALKALAPTGQAVQTITADVTRPDSIAAMIAEAMGRFGRLDILVNNAGVSLSAPPQDMALADWQKVLDVNLTAPFLCAQAVYPLMKAQGGGKIINIASVLATLGSAGAANYAASKGGVLQLTRSLAMAWADDNIQVNAILPGWIDTDLTRHAREKRADLDERVVTRTPAKRWGAPADLAGAAVFLSSAAADFVTGSALTVDGGFSIVG